MNHIGSCVNTALAIRNRDEVLSPHVCLFVCLFRGAVGSDFLLMDDNGCSQTTELVDAFLETEDTAHVDWGARSPDLNPIDICYLWRVFIEEGIKKGH